MDAHIDSCFTVSARTYGRWGDELASLYEVREHNTRAIQELAAKAHGILRAWCWKRRIQPPALWDPQKASAVPGELAGAEGVTDFRR